MALLCGAFLEQWLHDAQQIRERIAFCNSDKFCTCPLRTDASSLVRSSLCTWCIPFWLHMFKRVMTNANVACREELNKLGPLSRDEKITAGALGLTVGLWVFGGQLGIGAVAAALLGLAVLLITNVVTWKECLSDNQARPFPIYPSLPDTLKLPLAVLLTTNVVTWKECLSDNQARPTLLARPSLLP